MCGDLLQLRLTTSGFFVLFSLNYSWFSESFDAKAKYIVRDEYGRQQWTRSHMSTILKKIGMENALFIFLNMLAERRIIITGSNVNFSNIFLNDYFFEFKGH